MIRLFNKSRNKLFNNEKSLSLNYLSLSSLKIFNISSDLGPVPKKT